MTIIQSNTPDLLPKKDVGGIQFTFEGASTIEQVAVAGTFNCWVGDTYPLARISATRWQATLPIATGRHLYKYVVSQHGEQHWIPDPANPWISEDGQNNSCFTVNESGDALIRLGAINAATPGDLYQLHRALASPEWLKDAVIYQLSTAAFGGDFKGVKARLPYLCDLGIDVIWLMPIYPIGQKGRLGAKGDPYAVFDFGSLDLALGSAAELRDLIDEVHRLGMRILLDWTLNRSSCDNPLTVSHPDWFTHDAEGEIYYAVPFRTYFAGFDFSHQDLRSYLIQTMQTWLVEFNFDGFRFDDSDITPLDFLNEIRAALVQTKPDIGIISQAYDEFHHLAACDLTYEGGTRDMILHIAAGTATAADFAQYWNASTYSFPRDALRLRWIEDKEQGRAAQFYGTALHRAAAAIILTLDGVPHILMGQEFNEPRWHTWTSLFEEFQLDWSARAALLDTSCCFLPERQRHGRNPDGRARQTSQNRARSDPTEPPG